MEEGDAKGSPTDLIGNFRDSAAVSERKKGEIVAGCIRMKISFNSTQAYRTNLERIEDMSLDISSALRLKNVDCFTI
jgi:hypothetical protein